MDRPTIEELLDYDEWAWRQICDKIAQLGLDLAGPAPGSGWPALRDCLAHIARAYDIWQSLLDGTFIGFDVKAAASVGTIDQYRTRVIGHFRDYLAALSDEELHTDRDVKAYGETHRYTPAELLGNVVAHERGHHGDVSTLFYQLGLAEEMPMIDYRFYVDAKR